MQDLKLPSSMLAARVNPGSRKVALETIAIPPLRPHDALLKVAAVGLAPGPFKFLRAGLLSDLPRTLGHEVSGTIFKVGDAVSTLLPGQLVRLNPNLTCGSCRHCRGGEENACQQAAIIGFGRFGAPDAPGQAPSPWSIYKDGGLAEYLTAPATLFEPLPESVSFEVGAKIYELANAHCVLRAAGLRGPGSTIVITAPTGGLGTCSVRLASFFGVAKIILIGRSKSRCAEVAKLADVRCESIGLDELDPDWRCNSTKGLLSVLSDLAPEGVDAVLDFTPTEGNGVDQVVEAMVPYGTLVHVGGNPSVLPVSMALIMRQCLRITGSRIHAKQDVEAVVQWLKEGILRADDLISHVVPFDQLERGIELVLERKEPVWNVVARMMDK